MMIKTPDNFLDQKQRFAEMSPNDQALYECRSKVPYLAEKYRKQFLRFEGFKGKVLEVGCGEGIRAAFFPEATYIGIDLSFRRSSFAVSHRKDGLFLAGNACSLPFRTESFDAVFCYGLLHHLTASQIEEAFREMRRVCKAGGRIIAYEPNALSAPNFFLALLSRAERGILHSKAGFYKRILIDKLNVPETLLHFEYDNLPFPLFQIIFYLRGKVWIYGKTFTFFCELWDRLLRAIIPEKLWQLMIFDFLKQEQTLEK